MILNGYMFHPCQYWRVYNGRTRVPCDSKNLLSPFFPTLLFHLLSYLSPFLTSLSSLLPPPSSLLSPPSSLFPLSPLFSLSQTYIIIERLPLGTTSHGGQLCP